MNRVDERSLPSRLTDDAELARSTLAHRAAEALRDDLRSGRLEPGARIHLSETAAQLGMSPIPVREALRTLASEGLVVAVPNRGYRVPEVSLADLEDTYRLRMILDPLAVELAVPNLTPDELNRAEEALARLAAALRAEDWAGIRAANRDFHFVLYEAAGSPWLLRMISILWEASERYQRLSSPYRGTRASRRKEHLAILAACRAGETERAVRTMHDHLHRTYVIARGALGADAS